MKRLALLLSAVVFSSACAAVGLAGDCNATEIIANFDQVGDLVENADVQAADVEIGTVKSIELDGWEARVTMCIDQDEKVSSDVRAVVRSTSLLGEKFVDLQAKNPGPPFLQDGDVITSDQTAKASELEEVLSELVAVLGPGNLEQINRFTSAQAEILEGRAGEVREVLRRLRRFTDVLAERKDQVAATVDSFNSLSETILDNNEVLTDFLQSFADSSAVLADQKEGLQEVLFTLDRFSSISAQLLRETELGLNKQFRDLRPVLRTLAQNSANVSETLRTFATFSDWFPETMPGDYVQLDVCQALETFEQGTTCPQSVQNDNPKSAGGRAQQPANATELILRRPVGGER